MSDTDKTKNLLESLLTEIHREQSKETTSMGDSYLIAQDGQLLGKLTHKYDTESIINKYGPYGSRYSLTSIFNQYSDYGSKYGSNSINNPYCSTPPKLYIKGEFRYYISVNRFVTDRLDSNTFLYLLENKYTDLQMGKISSKSPELNNSFGESYIIADDGTFLGKLTSNQFDNDSLLNEYGPYGSRYSTSSIFNEYSLYGGAFSTYSPFNPYTATPPKIYVNGSFYAYLTDNEYISGKKIKPNTIRNWIKENF